MWRHLARLVPFVTVKPLLFLAWPTPLPLTVSRAVPTALAASAGSRETRQPILTGAVRLRGHRGGAVSAVAPDGLVRRHGDLSLAETRRLVAKGQSVEVIKMMGGASVRVC